MQVRQVVTGHDPDGRAVFVQDKKIDGTPIPGLGQLVFLWNADEPATYPDAGENPGATGIFPPCWRRPLLAHLVRASEHRRPGSDS